MTLYEFTFTSGRNLPTKEIEAHLKEFLESEAMEQEWAEGYEWVLEKVEEVGEYESKYYFSVEGQYKE